MSLALAAAIAATIIPRQPWFYLRMDYPGYLEWKKIGGPITPLFLAALFQDPDRDSLVEGLSYEQIRRKLPFLVDGDTYGKESYKSEYLQNLKKEHPEGKCLWFSQEDTFDFVVEVDRDGARIQLITG